MGVVASTLDPAGPAAEDIADLWWLLFWLGTAVFVLFAVLLGMALRRRSRSGDVHEQRDSEAQDLRAARPWLMGGGIVLPTVVIVVVLVATIFAMRATADDGPDGALTIAVTGHRWWWEVEYADGAETANEVHIPAGEPVVLELTSADVIHSFWVPALAGKMDALPDGVNTLVIAADEPGRYEGACAEFCGLHHASMNLVVVAHEPAAFQEWLDAVAEPPPRPTSVAARRGLELFRAEGCGSCHTIAGTSADGDDGPVLSHLMARVSMLGRGQPPTAEGLREWLTRPHDVKEGTEMPVADLSADEVDAVVAYLETLR